MKVSHRLLLWLAPLTFLWLFFFQPLARIFALALDRSALTQENVRAILEVSQFTFFQAVLSTLLTFALGLPAAILFARFEFRGKPFLRALTAIPFMLPTVVVAGAFNALLGGRLPGLNLQPVAVKFLLILAAHVFYNATIVIRAVSAALERLDPKLEDAARSLGADRLRVWRYVTLPLLRPSIFAAALLVFLFDFTSFGVILLLGGGAFSTLEVEIYLRVLKLPNLPLAALLAVVQLIFTMIFSAAYSYANRRASAQTAPRFAAARAAQTLREKFFVLTLTSLLTVFFLAPLAALPIRSVLRVQADKGQRGEVQYGLTADYYKELFINRRGSLFYVPPMQAAANSLGYAAATVALSLALGFPAASALARPARLEKVLDPLVMLPLGSSAAMLALGFILAFGRRLGSPFFVPIAHTLIALPFVIRALQPAMASIPNRLREAAAVLGASPFQVWRAIDFPILARAAVGAATFAFTISLGEFGATLLLARPEYPTLPVAIARFFSQPGGLNYGQAMAMATLLLALTLTGILWMEKIRMTDEF
ncbi:MAG: iron ABC transporter permease [Anaerolineales bacterium]